MAHEPYPLEWPVGRARTKYRKRSKFRDLSFASTRDDIFRQLKAFGASNVVLSTSVPVRRDGIPMAGHRQPDDPGVAVYFSLPDPRNYAERRYYAIACDAYYKVEENMRALVHTLAAMRTIERHGSSQLLEQAMSGFAALPASTSVWWSVLNFKTRPSLEEAKDRWREMVRLNHPDRGGSDERLRELNDAMRAAEQELS